MVLKPNDFLLARRILLVLCLLALAGLCAYSQWVGPGQIDTISEVLAHPREASREEIKLVSNVRVFGVGSDSLELQQGGVRITARVPDDLKRRWAEERPSIRQWDFVSLRATYDPEGYLLLRDFHIHHGRTFKIWLSAVALVLSLVVMVHEWRRERSA